MFSAKSMPSTTQVLSTYTTFAASAMLFKTVLNEVQTITSQLLPQGVQEKIMSKLAGIMGNVSNQMTLTIDETNGSFSNNEVFEAADLFLRTKINMTPSVKRLKVAKAVGDKNFSVAINKGEKILDTFEGVQLLWEMICTETDKSTTDYEGSLMMEKVERKSFELSFDKKYKEKVLNSYLPYIIEQSKVLKESNKQLKLYSLGYSNSDVNLNHPSNFDTLAMEPSLKKDLIDDLDRFLKRRDYYKRIGKAWKRGYLLYGPPGTGKSSLIAAMANYLKFNVYDLELTSVRGNAQLRQILLSTANRSILVIEDIDCSVELENRAAGIHNQSDTQLTLSGLLNFIDGLWSSCGDERIIVFTTNHKERLDPALLRPGRMDKHIHMSYCTPNGFKILASNYLNIKTHTLFSEIEKLITEVEVTPAEVAEQLMKSEETDIALEELIKFLQVKMAECAKVKLVESEKEGSGDGKGSEITSTDGGDENVKGNKRKSGKGKNIGTKKRMTRSRK